MTGGIQEGNVLSVDLYSVSTDVLGNTARLTGCNVGVSDRVEKRGLTVVKPKV